MKLSEHVHELILDMQLPGGAVMPLHLSLITDPVQGVILVDTGALGSLNQLRAALRAEGVKLEDIRRVLVSHHDTDHIGLLADVVRESGAEIWASASEQPFVQGEQSPQKHPTVPPLESLTGLRLSRVLHDDEVLDFAGGVRVIATPGHTVGHLSFLVEQDGVLIAGDALTSEMGALHGPHPQYSADVPEAMKSAHKLSKLPLKSIHTYHGGYVAEHAAEQLAQLLTQEAAH